nr:type II toxin-antitoxin system HigB family toxin [Catenovulum sediminis]
MQAYDVLRKVECKTPEELKQYFSSLDNFKYKDKWYVIDISGNNIRLMVFIEFRAGKMFVKHVVNHPDYDRHEPLIDMLSMSIEKYENTADEFQAFNDELKQLNSGVAALSVLMDQYKLNTTDFENEIGKKSLVSMILNGKRPLNLNHIRKLSERFNLPPQTFI